MNIVKKRLPNIDNKIKCNLKLVYLIAVLALLLFGGKVVYSNINYLSQIISGRIKNEDALFSFSATLMQSFSALIALPITFSLIHINYKYGYIGIEAIEERLRRVIFSFVVLFVISEISIFLQATTFSEKYNLTLIFLLEIFLSIALLIYLVYSASYFLFLSPNEIVNNMSKQQKRLLIKIYQKNHLRYLRKSSGYYIYV